MKYTSYPNKSSYLRTMLSSATFFIEPDTMLNPKKKVFEQVQVNCTKYSTCTMYLLYYRYNVHVCMTVRVHACTCIYIFCIDEWYI